MSSPGADASVCDRLRTLGVSRETRRDLARFAELLRHWTRRVNLVAPSTVDHLWERHILDSAQLCVLSPRTDGLWLDIGSGAGLPGLVCALVAQDIRPETQFALVESDRRKCAFLSTCVREFGLTAKIHTARIEELPSQSATVVSARALAPLTRLIALAQPHALPGATFLFPKGARYMSEIAEAQASWRFTATAHPSITDPAARILECQLAARV
ncbi:16S rRNA (guanine(527)-N(7))-methyltransferase RsmG [Rhodovulum sp. 12E13]|uniref:16S rRNA (guanine(527)-N(7))-methyltransferase RsmG n=1 Tax=Rhodovulum sp. 12E13 TaxID=2203891 RepID=UPI000E14A504|nr:16S rRNA (guanine(527)-N(7))-methyltransferase RsmG [Rhodovulum sp. 12E13]RDC73783.1 16S rRNA (guanine(527)-N(7))-methyltransferase RsmG [Rhodovulum sp. 12E13]